jgi:hypothetical protein
MSLMRQAVFFGRQQTSTPTSSTLPQTVRVFVHFSTSNERGKSTKCTELLCASNETIRVVKCRALEVYLSHLQQTTSQLSPLSIDTYVLHLSDTFLFPEESDTLYPFRYISSDQLQSSVLLHVLCYCITLS